MISLSMKQHWLCPFVFIFSWHPVTMSLIGSHTLPTTAVTQTGLRFPVFWLHPYLNEEVTFDVFQWSETSMESPYFLLFISQNHFVNHFHFLNVNRNPHYLHLCSLSLYHLSLSLLFSILRTFSITLSLLLTYHFYIPFRVQ